eukprot:10098495-Lingulodinium_polyedra.AAC.1
MSASLLCCLVLHDGVNDRLQQVDLLELLLGEPLLSHGADGLMLPVRPLVRRHLCPRLVAAHPQVEVGAEL